MNIYCLYKDADEIEYVFCPSCGNLEYEPDLQLDPTGYTSAPMYWCESCRTTIDNVKGAPTQYAGRYVLDCDWEPTMRPFDAIPSECLGNYDLASLVRDGYAIAAIPCARILRIVGTNYVCRYAAEQQTPEQILRGAEKYEHRADYEIRLDDEQFNLAIPCGDADYDVCAIQRVYPQLCLDHDGVSVLVEYMCGNGEIRRMYYNGD